MVLKLDKEKVKNILIFIFLVSISSFRLNYYIAVPAFLLILFYSIFCDMKIKISSILKWNILFWSYYLLSILWSRNINDTLQYTTSMIYTIGIMISIPKLVKNKEDINNFILLLFYSLAFTAIYILILTPINSFGLSRLGSSIMLNENIFGIRMSIGALLAVYILKNFNLKKHSLKKILVIFFLILFVVLSLFSGSKKALLFMALGIFVFLFLDAKGLKKFWNLFLVILIGIVGIFIIFNNERLYSVLGYRLERTYLTIMGNNSNYTYLNVMGNKNMGTTDKSLVERQFFMREALDLFKKHPILGYGGNGFRTYMKEINYVSVTYSHNNYTELLATLGIVGFSIYYYYWFKCLFQIFKFYKMSKDQESKKTSLLFLIIIGIFLMLDMGNVSYSVEFNLLMLCMCDCYIHYRKEQLE